MKCLALLSCEKLIIDKDGAHSIINVMLNAAVGLQEHQRGQVPRDLEVPPNAVTPYAWFIYSQWEPSPNDVGKSFEQVYQIYWPNDEKFIETKLGFTQQDDRVNQTTISVLGFPVGQQGKLRIVSWLDSNGLRVSDIAEAYVRVTHNGKKGASPSRHLPSFYGR